MNKYTCIDSAAMMHANLLIEAIDIGYGAASACRGRLGVEPV